MDVTPLIRSDQQVIQGYKSGSFRISSQNYEGAVVVFPEEVKSWDEAKAIKSADDIKSMSMADLKPVIDQADDLDLLILGCGERTVFVSPDLRKELHAKGINIECMDTGAACRTYNVLMAEGRRLVAALLPV